MHVNILEENFGTNDYVLGRKTSEVWWSCVDFL